MSANNKNFITENFLMFLVPILTYGTTYLYEVKIAKLYGIPLELIEVSFTNIFLALSAVGFVILLIYAIREAVDPIWIKLHIELKKMVILDLVFVIVFIFLLFDLSNIISKIIAGFIFSLIIFPHYILPFLTKKRRDSFIAKITASNNAEFSKTSFIEKIFDKHRFVYVALMTTWLMYFLTHLASGYTVNLKYEYYTINNGKEVLLKIYGKKVVTAYYDKKTNVIKRALKVRDISKFSQFTLKKENLGNLRLEERQPIKMAEDK